MNLDKIKISLLNFWPPFFFAGIKIIERSPDLKKMTLKLKLRFWNANWVGTAYGGSIFSMTDPFYMLMLITNLGPKYVVWDKSACIKYLKPGKTDLIAVYQITDSDLNEIKSQVNEHGKMNWTTKVEVKDKSGIVVAEVEKTVWISYKREIN